MEKILELKRSVVPNGVRTKNREGEQLCPDSLNFYQNADVEFVILFSDTFMSY